MLILKTKTFAKWAKKIGLADLQLVLTAKEVKTGLIDADFGKFLYKKRIALPGKGKRGGARAIIAYKTAEQLVFLLGFVKNERVDITEKEKTTLRKYVNILVHLEEQELTVLLENGELVKVAYE
jgi:hypothetical protein